MGTMELRLLTPEGVENMKRFKYRGVDLSLLYRYFSGPLAETCVHLLPRWLACVPGARQRGPAAVRRA